MKILEIYKEKLRYKKYSNRSIKLYISYLASFINIEKIKELIKQQSPTRSSRKEGEDK
jgi:hypothetical protein